MSNPAATIFALATPPGRSALAVIRISGPRAGEALDRFTLPRPAPRTAALRRLRHPRTADPLDDALVLWFPGPRSETGEDIAELQIHGGPAVIMAVTGALAALPGLRLAEPGEFIRRAFENGKLDLTAVEGLADLIDAETEAQRKQALRQSSGALARLYDAWRGDLLQALALVESAIDFSDEGDVASDAYALAVQKVEPLAGAIAAHLADGRRGEILRQGYRVVIAGPPNVGKSSLLNTLSRRDVAIVSPEAGTTRDVIEVALDLDGLPVIISDTAGIRDTEGTIEREGIRRALARVAEADLTLWLMDATDPHAPPPPSTLQGDILRIGTKLDLQPIAPHGVDLAISTTSGAGMRDFVATLAAKVRSRLDVGTAAPALTQARHRRHLEVTRTALVSFLANDPRETELRAEDLRGAASELGRITGRIDAEEVLGQIFTRFCIGK